MEFRWNEWNVSHVAEHGVTPTEAEEVVRGARPPYPEHRGDGKWWVPGRTLAGRFVQVVFVEESVGPYDVYVIHARPLTEREKRKYRRR
jgi:uncharacterized DUF497 family protein